MKGSGADLPAIVGLDNLQKGKCILDIGNKRLIYPGDGEVQIILPPGSVTIPLHVTESGHLCQVLNDYGSLATCSSSNSDDKPELEDQKTQDVMQISQLEQQRSQSSTDPANMPLFGRTSYTGVHSSEQALQTVIIDSGCDTNVA